MIEVRVQHSFEGFTLDVAFEAPAGVTAIFGRSGAGKTTLVNAVAGLLRPDAARIVVGGRVLAESGIWLRPEARRIGYVFQDARLFPLMTVRRNLAYGGGGDIGPVVDMLGIAHLLERMPAHLSGGETQRVAIGRALLSSPDLLLMDEPLASLDDHRKQEILPYLMRLRDTSKIPILFVSHALSEVAQLANTLVLLDQGRCVATGPIDAVLSDPKLVPHLGVRGAGAVLTGAVVAHHEDGLTEVSAPGGTLFVPKFAAMIGQKTRIRIEAQDVILSRGMPQGLSALNVLRGRVSAVQMGDGPGAIVQIDMQGTHLLARVTRRSLAAMSLELGQEIYAIAKTVAVAPGDIGPVGNG